MYFSSCEKIKTFIIYYDKTFKIFELSRVSPGDQLLLKEPEDSGYEIAVHCKS